MDTTKRCACAGGIGLPEISFQKAMQAVYGQLDCQPIADGLIHRFHIPGDKPGTLAGWYVLFLDGIASGAFGSWKAGGSRTWNSRQPANHHEAEQIQQRIEQARRQRELVQRQRQQATAAYAERIWNKAHFPSGDYPYLMAKGVQSHNLRQSGDPLLVPLYLADQLVNLQRIYPDGTKRFLSGGLVKGACSYLGAIVPGEVLYLCEGWATGATIHERTGAAVACAMNAGNLLEVGRILQRQHPDAVLIVAGDDDRLTEGNPGRTAANNAANTLGCGLVFPPWSEGEPPELSDFNDLALWRSAQ